MGNRWLIRGPLTLTLLFCLIVVGWVQVMAAPLNYRVYGEIGRKWRSLGGMHSFLGAPVTDELGTPDGIGRFNHFEGGSIYWTPQTGAHEIHGAIRAKWARLGWETSFLGYPLTDETGTPDGIGRFNHFEGGSIYWTPQTGAHVIYGAIRDKWASLGWERGALRYPISDEYQDGRYRRTDFQHGYIRWSPQRGAEVFVSLEGDVQLNPVDE